MTENDDPLRRPPSVPAVVVVLGESIEPNDVRALCERTRAQLQQSGTVVVVCEVGAIENPDLATVDVLARLFVTARRLGGRMLMRGVGDALTEMLEFVGLGSLLAGSDVEPRGQAEQGEQALGIEKERHPGYPVV